MSQKIFGDLSANWLRPRKSYNRSANPNTNSNPNPNPNPIPIRKRNPRSSILSLWP